MMVRFCLASYSWHTWTLEVSASAFFPLFAFMCTSYFGLALAMLSSKPIVQQVIIQIYNHIAVCNPWTSGPTWLFVTFTEYIEHCQVISTFVLHSQCCGMLHSSQGSDSICMTLRAILHSVRHRECATNPIWHFVKAIPHDKLGIWYVGCPISECADRFLWCTCYRMLPLWLAGQLEGAYCGGWYHTSGSHEWEGWRCRRCGMGRHDGVSARGSCYVCA